MRKAVENPISTRIGRRCTQLSTAIAGSPDPRCASGSPALRDLTLALVLALSVVAVTVRSTSAQAAGGAATKRSAGEKDLEGVVLEGHVGDFRSVEFSRDGTQILTASSKEVRVWSADGREAPRVLRMPKRRNASSARFISDGERVAIVTSYALYVWRVDSQDVQMVFETELPKKEKEQRQRVREVVARPDGRYLAVVQNQRVSVIPTAGGSPVHIKSSWYDRAVFDGARHLILANAEGVRRFAADGSGEPEKIEVEDVGWIQKVAISPDGNRLVLAGRSATIIQLDTKEVSKLKKSRRWIQKIEFTKDGRLFTSSWDGRARLWNPDGESCIEFRTRGSFLSGGAVSSDGQYILTSSRSRGRRPSGARLWAVNGEGAYWPLGGHFVEPEHLDFTADGGRLLTAADDGRVIVRRVADVTATKATKKGRSGLDLRVRTIGERILLIMNGKRLGETIDVALANLGPAIMEVAPAERRRAVLDMHDDTPQMVRLSILKACLEGGVEKITWKDKRKPIPRAERGRGRVWEAERARTMAVAAEAKAEKKKGAKDEPIPLPKVVKIDEARATFNPKIVRLRMAMAGTSCEVSWNGDRIGTMPDAAMAALEKFKAKRVALTQTIPAYGRGSYFLVIDAGSRVPSHEIVRAADPYIEDGIAAMIVRGGYR